MLLFLNKSDPLGQIKAAEFVQLGKKLGIPTLNDAAADVPPVEDLFKYLRMNSTWWRFLAVKDCEGRKAQDCCWDGRI